MEKKLSLPSLVLMVLGIALIIFPVITMATGSTILSDAYAYLEYILLVIGIIMVILGILPIVKNIKKENIDCDDPENKDLDECQVNTENV